MSKILIVVDMQNDFITGPLGTKEAQDIVPAVTRKVKEYSDTTGVVFYTRDTHFNDYLETSEGKALAVKHCIYWTDGWEISYQVLKAEHFYNVEKATFGYIYWPETFTKLPIIPTEIELCGVCTDICVISNALILKAQYPEIKITVDSKCCAGTTPEAHEAALTVMKSCQINVI
jgi:nicotinamidase-related amidase